MLALNPRALGFDAEVRSAQASGLKFRLLAQILHSHRPFALLSTTCVRKVIGPIYGPSMWTYELEAKLVVSPLVTPQ